MAMLRLGTCSWKFPSWAGLVYSAPAGIDYLAEYAQRYNSVEVDQWFWSLFGVDKVRLPQWADAEAYRRSVPDDFRFSVKAPNSLTLTHLYSRGKTDPLEANPHFLSVELLESFLDAIEPLHDVLGPVMFQFEYLNQRKMRAQSDFQEQVARFAQALPRQHPYALETRNARYLNQSFFEFLNQHQLIPVLLQGYWMPPIEQTYTTWRSLIIQQPMTVIRLHGPDREGMEERTGKAWGRIVEPRDEELRAVVDTVQDLLSEGVDVYLNVNNHYEGSAPLTIERIRTLLGGRRLDVQDDAQGRKEPPHDD
ncbi:MAG: DUF72 domain-containing protein [Anaerolineales bacterium]|nr:DUF72 domain-containing protein [Anaerolineales bacterium]